MSTTSLEVRPARLSEFDMVLGLSAETFADEAVLSWVVPDPGARRAHVRALFAETLRATIEAGDLILALTPGDEAVAVSLWHDVDTDGGAAMNSGPADVSEGSGPTTRRLHAVATATADRHPAEPHLYLSSMATRSEFRGRGAGAAMVRSGIDRARDLDRPIYLEASTPQNRRLYLRNGFTDHGEPIALPEDGPVLQPMWRQSTT